MKILITGASGFIGSHLTRKWVAKKAEVYVLTKYLSQAENVRLLDIWDKLKFLEGDIRNLDSLAPMRKIKFDKVFHLAAYNHVGDSFLHISENLDTNGKGTANLLESCEGFKRFVYISTSEVYGKQDSVPFREDFIPNPISPYSVGKYAGELYCKMKHEVFGLPITILRPFNTFGPYQSEKAVIPELIMNCLRGKDIVTTRGKQTREFNFVANIIDGMIAGSESKATIGKVTNLGSREEISIKDLAVCVHQLTKSKSKLKIGKLPYRPIEIWRMSADHTLAWERFKWKPKIAFQEGLKQTVQWYKKYLKQFRSKNSPLVQLGKRGN
ncbi:MAG: GDP-mannose 4,6-dehydratase [Nitrospinota bacterium]|nr:GDP-mannose 4,6-dehydratase [Nitrospinota bacterium]